MRPVRLTSARTWGMALLIAWIAGVARAQPTSTAPFWFGDFEREIAGLHDPVDAAVDGEGRMHVLERLAARVSVYSRGGERLGAWGVRGDGPGELLAPRGIALAAGRVFITDEGLHRVCVFAPDGTFISSWGRFGSESGAFCDPSGVAADAERVVVCDTGNDRVQVFDHEGRLVRVIGSRGTGEGQFRRPVDAAIAMDGSIHIVDADNARVQVFDANGRFVRAFGEWGPFVGLLDDPTGIVLHGGEALVVDHRNHRVQAFSSAGGFLGAWGIHEVELHEGQGKVHYPTALAVDPRGAFAVLVERVEDRVQVFGAVVPPPGLDRTIALVTPPKADQTHFGRAIAADGPLLMLADPENHFTVTYDMRHEAPVIINQFGERGDRSGLLRLASCFDLDLSRGRLLIADPVQQRLQEWSITYDAAAPLKFDPDMASFSGAIDLDRLRASVSDAPLAHAMEPVGLGRLSGGELVVLDRRNRRVVLFDRAMNFVRSWGRMGGVGGGEFLDPVALAVDRVRSEIAVLDALRRDVQIFDDAGILRRVWRVIPPEESRTPTDETTAPSGLTIAPNGDVLVTDAGGCRVLRFSRDGEFKATWGKRGVGMSEFWKPGALTVAHDGLIVVVDQGNHRAQSFDGSGEWIATFGLGRAFTRSNPPRQVREEGDDDD